MAKLSQYISSDYVSAANRLRGKSARKRIVVYVESYDDVLFWRMALSDFEDETRYFEVMLPSRRHSLNRGKKSAIMAMMAGVSGSLPTGEGGGRGLGPSMIACVDADYDYLMQRQTEQSQQILDNPYVVHTYVYAIENYQCYAPSLHNVCVMATLNDHPIFDFVEFLTEYSRAIFPLFVWSIMVYRKLEYRKFTISEFNEIVTIRHTRYQDMIMMAEKVRNKVQVKLKELRKANPGRKEEYIATRDELISLGVTPETTYLYIQGHHLFDNVVAPTLQSVCDELRREREGEIRRKATHALQLQNELSAYTHAQCDITDMLKKNTGYTKSAPYKQMIADIENVLSYEASHPSGTSEDAK